MKKEYIDIIIALSGILQNASIVTDIALNGTTNNAKMKTAIRSIFNTNPTSTADTFGQLENIKDGLAIFFDIYNAKKDDKTKRTNIEIVKYLLSTISLAHTLVKNKKVMDKISARLLTISSFYSDFSDDAISENQTQICHSLAGIYSDLLSPLKNKIKVNGRIEYLQNPLNQAIVRTSLFACVRAAILWHQVGGRRLQFLLSKSKLKKAGDIVLYNINQA